MMPNRLPDNIIIEPLPDRFSNLALHFLVDVFHKEQNIPTSLIPLKSSQQYWWCVRIDEQIIGTVIVWEEANEWHWGRFAIDKNFRKMGIGKKLAFHSIQAAFEKNIEYLLIEARAIPAKMLEEWGGKKIADKNDFYGAPVYPMILHKNQFEKNIG